MSLVEFRDKVQQYRRTAGITQKVMAHELGLNASVLSHKMHGADGMVLAHTEVKRIVLLLAKFHAITTCEEATDLLAFMKLRPSVFTEEEWASEPLSELENEPTNGAAAHSSVSAESVHHNLPASTTTLLGRAALLADICKRLLTPGIRLITLTGPAGVGKTRLAVEAAWQSLERFNDGVFFVPLGGITDPDLVASEIAYQLNLKDTGGAAPIKLLKQHFMTRNTLLVLDNFEHLLEALPVVSDLLTAAPELKVLVTSRIVLNLYGEHQIAVQPLELPDLQCLGDPDQMLTQPAVALFVAIAQSVRSDFRLTDANLQFVAQICVRLDGLPLALELAAALCRLFSPAAVLQRLDQPLDLSSKRSGGITDRRQTLRETISRSYLLLNTVERRIFETAALFPGGCTVEAVEAILSAEHNTGDILEHLSSMLDKSLLFQREGKDLQVRFQMLETLREYALEQLASSGNADLLHREQARYYVALVQSAAAQLNGERQMQMADLLEAEHNNLRALLSWSLRAMPRLALQLCGGLWYFWLLRGYLNEGQRWLEQALAYPLTAEASSDEKAEFAKVRHGNGSLAYFLGEFDKASLNLEAALVLRRDLNDVSGMASTLNNLGNLAWDKSDLDRAQQYYEEVVILAQTQENRPLQAKALNNLGGLLWQRENLEAAHKYLSEALAIDRALQDKIGLQKILANLGIIAVKRADFDTALVYYAESLALARELGDQRSVASTLGNIGEVALNKADYALAQRYYAEALALHREVNFTWGIGTDLANLAGALLFQNEYERALVLLHESLTLMRKLGDRAKLVSVLDYLGMAVLRIGDSTSALDYYREALKLNAELESENGIAMSLACIAAALSTRGERLPAARLWGAAYALWATNRKQLLPIEEQRFAEALKAAREETDSGAFEEAWQDGAQNVETVVQETL